MKGLGVCSYMHPCSSTYRSINYSLNPQSTQISGVSPNPPCSNTSFLVSRFLPHFHFPSSFPLRPSTLSPSNQLHNKYFLKIKEQAAIQLPTTPTPPSPLPLKEYQSQRTKFRDEGGGSLVRSFVARGGVVIWWIGNGNGNGKGKRERWRADWKVIVSFGNWRFS